MIQPLFFYDVIWEGGVGSSEPNCHEMEFCRTSYKYRRLDNWNRVLGYVCETIAVLGTRNSITN